MKVTAEARLSFDVKFSWTLLFHRFILLADLREHVADAGFAVSLAVAVEDVLNAVEHLFG